MAKQPDDRPRNLPEADDRDPRIYIIINGEKFPRPGLESYFVRVGDTTAHEGCACHPVAELYCSCHKACDCVGHSESESESGGGYYRTGCSCAPVH